MRFKDKVCIVTGGGSGIGRAVCNQLASEGGRVVVVDISEKGGSETVEEIKANGGQALFVKTDVAVSTEVRRAVTVAFTEWQKIDVLINNAAMMVFNRVVDLDEEDWDRVMAVNLRSCFLFCKYCIPHMEQGVIVNVSSVHAHQTGADVSSYAASKGGVEAFSRALSQEYGPDQLRVNCVAPGGTNTPLLWSNPAIQAMNPNDVVVAEPAQIASVICFLASDEARTIHGSTVVTDLGVLSKL